MIVSNKETKKKDKGMNCNNPPTTYFDKPSSF